LQVRNAIAARQIDKPDRHCPGKISNHERPVVRTDLNVIIDTLAFDRFRAHPLGRLQLAPHVVEGFRDVVFPVAYRGLNGKPVFARIVEESPVPVSRRLIDPLAELVKIEPKSIGVGQYQHDVDQAKLKHGLDDVVMSCVNAVGVEVNTASQEILTYVSGLGPVLAKNIVEHRKENGPFRSRAALKKVKRLGPKAFEQAAGFLRVRASENPLDRSAVHPESYPLVERMAEDVQCSILNLMEDPGQRKRLDLNRYCTAEVGLPTLQDILEELAKPGRDPRDAFEAFSFAEGIESLEDLEAGMRLPGIVTNVTNFGAFVDVGVHQDGLVHISQLADRFVKDPNEVVKVHQKVMVTVLEVDLERKRIALSLRSRPS